MTKIKFSKNQLAQMKSMYVDQRLSIFEIGKYFNCSGSTISRRLHKLGVDVHYSNSILKFDLDKDVIPLYEKGVSITKLAKQFGTTRKTLTSKLKERGIPIVNYQNKTKFNEHIFDSIDTEEKAYWLGFMYADGCISSSNYSFYLNLKGSDIGHLLKFQKFIEHNKNIVKLSQNGKCTKCTFTVSNKHMWTTLNSYGCIPRKSLVLKFPDKSIFKDESLIRHFIRGYFDGDGCLTFSHTEKIMHLRTSLIGTNSFITKVREYLIAQGINVGRILNNPGISYCLINIHSKSFLDYIYQNAIIYLDRKFNLWSLSKTCRLTEEFVKLLQTKNGEGCDVNPVVIEETKESSTP